MRMVFIALWQCTWGLLQTALGAAVCLCCRRAVRYPFRGALVTEWARKDGLSLGLFVFIPQGLTAGRMRLLRHEYGHSMQSLLLGPLYLPAVGLPSLLWAQLKACREKRRREGIDYFAFFTERWADAWGGVGASGPDER